MTSAAEMDENLELSEVDMLELLMAASMVEYLGARLGKWTAVLMAAH
jgi:hypothetical protein